MRGVDGGLRGWALAVFACFGLVAALLLIDIVTWPVDALMPDARGWMRWMLVAASIALALALVTLWRHRGASRRAPPGEARPPRFRRAGWVAVAAVAVLAWGWMSQQRLNGPAGVVRVWPEKVSEGIRGTLATRYEGDSVVVMLRIACPGTEDCMDGRRFVVRLRGPGARPSVTASPEWFARLSPGVYAGTAGIRPHPRWYGRREYLSATDWAFSAGPWNPPSPILSPPAGSAPAEPSP